MATTNTLAKPKTRERSKNGQLPPHADYSDVVTDEYRARIAAAVPEEDYSDAKVESGPAW